VADTAEVVAEVRAAEPPPVRTITVESQRFGVFEVPEESIFELDPGLVGFPDERRFVVLDSRPGSPFKWMLCVDEPDLAFAVIDPATFVPSYAAPIDKAAEVLRCDRADVALFVLVTIPARPTEIYANLLAPVVVDLVRRKGRQLVLEDPTLDPAHRIPLL
jgi:flagellar assembly factor FliW